MNETSSDKPEESEVPAEDVDSLELSQAENDDLNEPDPEPFPVTYSGTDFDVDGLVRRLNKGDIVVPTFGMDDESIETAGFQRSFVWRRPQMDRFIESLLLGYPIPGIFLVEQSDRRYLVLDGQQRLRTLAAFFKGVHENKAFSLQNVAPRFQGLTYETMTPEARRQLENTFVPATIVKTDGSTASLDTVYQIFERLNSGGTQLTPHEIRVALYAGRFVEFLSQLNRIAPWRSLYGPESPRLRDQEILLRAVALYVSPGNYRRPLKKYLNDFVSDNRDLAALDTNLIKSRITQAASLLLDGAGPASIRLRKVVNAALTEAVLVGLARRLDVQPAPLPTDVADAVASLLANDDLLRSIERATADEESVRTRLALATKSFAAI